LPFLVGAISVHFKRQRLVFNLNEPKCIFSNFLTFSGNGSDSFSCVAQFRSFLCDDQHRSHTGQFFGFTCVNASDAGMW
jgi:hypothetical protein